MHRFKVGDKVRNIDGYVVNAGTLDYTMEEPGFITKIKTEDEFFVSEGIRAPGYTVDWPNRSIDWNILDKDLELWNENAD